MENKLPATKQHQIVRCDNIFEKNIHSGTADAFRSEVVETETNNAKLELQNSVDSGAQMDDMEKPFITPCKALTVAKKRHRHLQPAAPSEDILSILLLAFHCSKNHNNLALMAFFLGHDVWSLGWENLVSTRAFLRKRERLAGSDPFGPPRLTTHLRSV
ncbi:hypothetical protein KIW84_031107 [Lathyrus oleraceus]|uniref:Uncharacterized protein n=1 Tax=Pisum sativum TaxID=3888 RepID=A0A9D4XPQ6_PEA|nr:hypothetical protein KIW84_031107 [Pisum sativum]